MAQQVLILPDGQRLNPAQISGYSVTSTSLNWVLQSGGTGVFNGYGGATPNLINYQNLLRVIDITIASGVDGFYNLAELMGYVISGVAPASPHSAGTTPSIIVVGSGFDQTMVGNKIYIEDTVAWYDSNSTYFTVASVDSPNQLTATWTSDGDNGSFNLPCFAYYMDANGYLYGRCLGLTVLNP